MDTCNKPGFQCMCGKLFTGERCENVRGITSLEPNFYFCVPSSMYMYFYSCNLYVLLSVAPLIFFEKFSNFPAIIPRIFHFSGEFSNPLLIRNSPAYSGPKSGIIENINSTQIFCKLFRGTYVNRPIDASEGFGLITYGLHTSCAVVLNFLRVRKGEL